MEFWIEIVDAAATFPLRHRVLRPDDTDDELAAMYPDALHFAAPAPDGEVASCALLLRERPPWDAAEQAWRLRGMATSPERQNQGVGALVVEALVDHVVDHGGGLIWCSARLPARGFYERLGFVAHGEEWIDPRFGPHIHMERAVG